MGDAIALYASEDSEGRTQVFTLPNATFADIGDLLEYDGEYFPVKDKHITFPGSFEQRVIASLCTIRVASGVYELRWRVGNE